MAGFILTVVVAAIVGWISNSVTKGNILGEFWGATLAGLVGAWIGGYLPYFSKIGPIVGGIAIVPTIIGSVIGAFVLGLFKGIAVQTK